MAMVMDLRIAHLPAPWRATCVILREQFPNDEQVWSHVTPGVSVDLFDLIGDLRRPMRERVMLAVAQGLADSRPVTVPVAELIRLNDRQLRSVLDALAIARGSLPID